jgi:hypothetical protein
MFLLHGKINLVGCKHSVEKKKKKNAFHYTVHSSRRRSPVQGKVVPVLN